MVDPVRLALFGAGGIGVRHLALAEDEPECAIVAVADPLDAAAVAARRHGARFYRDFRELLTRERLDGAIVATPNDSHAEVGIACVPSVGLPVLMEKPITDTAGIRSCAPRRRGRLARGAARGRSPPPVRPRRRHRHATRSRAGRIGRLAAGASVSGPRASTMRILRGRLAPRTRPGGGPALINLVHDVDLLRHLCGDVVRVYAEGWLGAAGVRGGGYGRGHPAFREWCRRHHPRVRRRRRRRGAGSLGTGENPLDVCPPAATAIASSAPRVRSRCRGSSCGGTTTVVAARLARGESVPAPWPRGPRAALKDQLRHFCGMVRGEHAPRGVGRGWAAHPRHGRSRSSSRWSGGASVAVDGRVS